MMHVELQSKLIDAAEYDKATRRLKLFLASGQIREFVEVPTSVFDDLQTAKSPGSYYFRSIKDRYPYA